MCCGNGGGSSRPAAQTRQRTGTPRAAGGTGLFTVTLPNGDVLTGLTEHQALMATLKNGGGMEPERPKALRSATPI
jgi:hypothetical protein